jgi:hypothetical protein
VAIDMVLQVMYSYAKQAEVGLLESSGYGPTSALIELEWRIDRQTASCDKVIDKAQLRRDITAIYNAFSTVCPENWNENLLRAPAGSGPRRVHRRRISSEDEGRLVDFLIHSYRYEQTESANVISVMLNAGLEALIDIRSGSSTVEAGIVSQRNRLRKLIDSLYEPLADEQRLYIMQHLDWLQESFAECQIGVSLPRIVAEQPLSPFRRRLKRRLPTGFGVIQYLRRKPKREQAPIVNGMHVEIWNQQLDRQEHPLDTAARLLQAYARRANLNEQIAASRLYDIWTYGAVGFIPRTEWLTLVDARLLALLKLYKFGRIEGRLVLGYALCVMNSYAQMLGQPAISVHLARALLALLTKPGRWNSGESEKLAAVRKRAGIVLPGVPWLHRVWRIIVLPVPLRIAESYYSPAGECWLIVVIDLGSQFPVGCWVCAHKPKARDAKLALFQAIWHPGAIDWPLRGIPEVIQVPASVVGSDAEEMRATAHWLLASFQIVEDTSQRPLLAKMTDTTAFLRELMMVGLNQLRRSTQQHEFTVKEVQDWVLKWLRESRTCFGTARPALSDIARIYGFAAPGFDTQAAGLLLPVVGTAVTARNVVLVGERRYADSTFHCEPGQSIRYRQFPYIYQGPAEDEYMRDTIFVEGSNGVLHYLTRQ